MAIKKAPQLTAAAERQVIATDDGDVLLPLKRVRDQYTRKAQDMEENAYGDNRQNKLDAAAWYRRAADAVQLTIGVINVVALVEPPAPVDQTEEITSEFATLNTLCPGFVDSTRLDDGDAIAAAVGEHHEVPSEIQ